MHEASHVVEYGPHSASGMTRGDLGAVHAQAPWSSFPASHDQGDPQAPLDARCARSPPATLLAARMPAWYTLNSAMGIAFTSACTQQGTAKC